MQSIIDQTKGKNFQQKTDKSSCHIFTWPIFANPEDYFPVISGSVLVGEK